MSLEQIVARLREMRRNAPWHQQQYVLSREEFHCVFAFLKGLHKLTSQKEDESNGN